MNTTASSIDKGNKLIAEFMGLRVDQFPDKSDWWYVDLNNPESIYHNKNESLFHTSWDWLMPVVEKIKRENINIGERANYEPQGTSIEINFYSSEETVTMWNETGWSVKMIGQSIDAVWKAVVEYIQWYNQQEKI